MVKYYLKLLALVRYWIEPIQANSKNHYWNDNKLVLKLPLVSAFSRVGFLNSNGWSIRSKYFFIIQKYFNDLSKKHIKSLLLYWFKTTKMPIQFFLFRFPNVSILDKREIFSIKRKRLCKKLVCSLLKINSEFSFYMKLPTTLFYMTREQENYILEWSRKHKLNIKLIALVFKIDNPNIWRFQWLENILLCITFAIQYFS